MNFAAADGVNIYYETHGDGDPLLLISGMGADHRVWSEIVPELQKDYLCIVYDHRGIGYSGRPSGDYTIRELAADASQLLKVCGGRKAHVIGISMGGAVAQELAINCPGQVRSLVLVSTWAKPDAFRRVLGECRTLAAKTVDRYSFWREHLLWCYPREYYRENGEKIEEVCRFLADTDQSREELVRQNVANLFHDTSDRLHLISAPTLIIVGAKDISTPRAFAEELYGGIEGSRLVVLEECGHSLTSQNPAGFRKELRKFLHALD